MKVTVSPIKIFFTCLWCENMLIALIQGFLPDVLSDIFSIFIAVVVTIIFLFCIRKVVLRMGFHCILFSTFMIVTVIITALFGVAKEICQENIAFFFVKVLPYFYAGLLFPLKEDEQNDLIGLLYHLSLINVFTGFLYVLYYIGSGRNFTGINDDAMQAAYNLIPSLLLVVLYFVKKRDIYNTACFILGAVCLMIYGNRGSVLCLFVWFIVCILFIADISKKKRAIIVSLSVIATIVFFVYSKEILLLLSTMFGSWGFSTRIFESILSGTIADANGRDMLFNTSVEYLRNNPYTICGWYFDRLVLIQYAHNFILEICLDFGIVGGSIILLSFGRLIVKSCISITNLLSRQFVLLFVTYVCVHLFLSSSIMLDSSFYLLMGIVIVQYDNRKKDWL